MHPTPQIPAASPSQSEDLPQTPISQPHANSDTASILLHDNDDNTAAGPGELLHNDDATPQLLPLMAEPPEITAEQTGPSQYPTGATPNHPPVVVPLAQSIPSPTWPPPLSQPSPPPAALRHSTRVRRPPERYRNNFILRAASLTYLLAPWSAPVQAAMHLDWHDTPKCQITRQFDDLLQQATCEVNQEIFEVHPLSFHVRQNANDLDEPTYKEVSQSDALELRWWQDAIDAELAALQEKCCFNLVDQAEAEGQQIVDSTRVFKQN